MQEIWKDILNYEGLYQVSNLGRVKSFLKGKETILKQWYDSSGYAQVKLFKKQKGKIFLVHRLVASAFIKNENKLDTVNHKDKNRKNNIVSNLEWLSNGDNTRYSQAKQINQYDRNMNLICSWECIMEIERKLNIKNSSIVSCCKGKRKTAGGYIWKYKDAI